MARRNQRLFHPPHPAHSLPESLAGRKHVPPGQPGNKMTKPKARKGAK